MGYCYIHRVTPPFAAFRSLRELATEAVGEENVLDISQGEPGYGFAPSVRGRRLAAFVNLIDIELNNNEGAQLFACWTKDDLGKIEAIINNTAYKNFNHKTAVEILKDWQEFITRLEKVCSSQFSDFGRFEVYYELFKYSNLTGGRYPQPNGNPLLAALQAEIYSEELGYKVYHDELISVTGASQGIVAIFKALGEEGLGYLKKGDTVLMVSPVYAPYNELFKGREINVVNFSISPETGEFAPSEIEKCKNSKEKIKAIILIEPNNPTGFAGSKDFMKAMIEIADTHDSIIISDEVYYRFHKNIKSIAQFEDARKRLIRIESISKTERATGLRVGDVYISKDANKYISEHILQGYLQESDRYKDFFELVSVCKSPGGKNIGLFHHITGVPGPSVVMALAHLILGRDEAKRVVSDIAEKMVLFYKNLGVEYYENMYYGMFDLLRIGSEENKRLDIQEKLERIAKKGVVMMPAYLFFSMEDRLKRDCNHFVRASLPNLSKENIKKAALIIREVLES